MIGLGYDFTKIHVLETAFELDIFERLGSQSKTARTLADELGADTQSFELFLNALVSLGFLKTDGRAYQNTKLGREIFLKEKPLYVGDTIHLHASSIPDWLKLKEAVLSGQPVDKPDFLKKDAPELVSTFIRAMHKTAVGHAQYLAENLSLGSAKTLLDLGGGSGAFTVYFLQANPELQAVIFDLPLTLETTREFVAKAGLGNRIEFQAGDFDQGDIGGMFDVCFVSHIIHGQNVEKNKKLFRKIFVHLNPKGKLILQDFFLNRDRRSPQFAALFALTMLLHTSGGRTYAFDEVTDWLREAGFSKVFRPSLKLPRSISLLVGEKK